LNTNRFCYSEKKKIDCHNWISRDLFDFYKNFDWIPLNFFNLKKYFKIIWNINLIHPLILFFENKIRNFIDWNIVEPNRGPVRSELSTVALSFTDMETKYSVWERTRRRRTSLCCVVLHQGITTIFHLSSHLRHPSPVSTSSLSPSCNFPFPFFISSATIWLLLDFIFSALLLRLLLLFCFFVTTCWVQTAPSSDVSFYFGHFSSEMWSSSISISIVCLNA
jgi:hypothetical protein